MEVCRSSRVCKAHESVPEILRFTHTLDVTRKRVKTPLKAALERRGKKDRIYRFIRFPSLPSVSIVTGLVTYGSSVLVNIFFFVVDVRQ